jgi:hypothetical protein
MTLNELYHHGILGMKWGVRRYQNYDGTYTKKGLERYNSNQEKYEQSAADYKKAKTAYKSGKITKLQLKESKASQRQAKKELSESYDKLKIDKRADQGKKLYSEGKTIANTSIKYKGLQGAITLGSSVVTGIMFQKGNTKMAVAGAAVAVGGGMVNGILKAKSESDAKKLRAYYTH